ncbi:MAG: Holliday junction resolvase RuvX, partial [Candidatus Brocadiia bacterium]
MRIMALDHGDRRVGVAISDPLEIAAHAVTTLESDGSDRIIDDVRELVEEKDAELVVVGLPINMNGSEGERAQKARSFAKKLRRILVDVPVKLSDERLSSAEAHRALSQQNVSMGERGRRVDQMAAQVILRRYMRARENSPSS